MAGHQLYQFTCVGASQQLWDTDLTPGFSAYSIQSVYSNLYMDVNGGSSSRGAAIDTWYWNGGQNQYFGAYQG